MTAAFLVVGVATACGGSGGQPRVAQSTARTTTSAPAPAPASTSVPIDVASSPCQATAAPPTYAHVVVIMMENRSWTQVGGVGFGSMPFLGSLAQHCAYYADWTQTNPGQSSLTQYIGLTSGVDNARTVDDCSPSASCFSTDDNIFRQVRTGGGIARSYVEGASVPCSAVGNAAKHVPALYYRGAYSDGTATHRDDEFCTEEVRPFSELDPDHLPTLAFVTPDLCHDGHDCPNDAADAWARAVVGAIVGGADYRARTTAILVLWDESAPVPNLLVAPSARGGPCPGVASHASALTTIEAMLGLPPLPHGVAPAADLRASSGL